MSVKNHTAREAYVHPDDPANHIRPGEAFIVDGLDWSWAFCVFRPIEGFPAYRVGSNGTVWSCLKETKLGYRHGSRWDVSETWRPLKLNPAARYPQVILANEGKRQALSVHRIVLEAFVGPCPEGWQGCHFDDDKGNNRFWNLRWDSQGENAKDAIRNDRQWRGSAIVQSKLTEDQVLAIREAYARPGSSMNAIGREFGVSQSMVSKIIKGTQWAHVAGPLDGEKKHSVKLTQEKADRIRELVGSGMHKADVGREFGVARQTVNDIVTGRAWVREDAI